MILSTVLILDDVLPCQMAWYLQIIVLFHLGKVQKLLHHNPVMITEVGTLFLLKLGQGRGFFYLCLVKIKQY